MNLILILFFLYFILILFFYIFFFSSIIISHLFKFKQMEPKYANCHNNLKGKALKSNLWKFVSEHENSLKFFSFFFLIFFCNFFAIFSKILIFIMISMKIPYKLAYYTSYGKYTKQNDKKSVLSLPAVAHFSHLLILL